MDNTQQQSIIAGYTLIKEIGATCKKTLFLVKKNNQYYIMKVFKPQQNKYFINQFSSLQILKHPNIIKIIQKLYQVSMLISFGKQIKNNCNIIITQFVCYGNIINCLKKIRYCNENVTRTLIKQLLEALLYSNKKNIFHGAVTGYDILIDCNRSIKLSGWSQSQSSTQKDLIFSVGQIIILMLTGHPPFVRHNQNDLYYKFIHQKTIEKFWESISKRTKQKFSNQVVDLVNNIFLKKQFTLEDIAKSQWIQQGQTLQLSQMKGFFKERQQQFEDKEKKNQKEKLEQKERFQKLKEKMQISTGKRGHQNDFQDKFVADYYQCSLTFSDLKVRQYISDSIQIKEKIPFVYAWIRKAFKVAYNDKNPIIFPLHQAYIGKQKIQIIDNQLKIQLQFMNYPQESSKGQKQFLQENENDIGKLTARIKFYKNSSNQTYAIVTIDQTKQQWQNEFYIQKLKYFIENQLRELNQISNLKTLSKDNKQQQQCLN